MYIILQRDLFMMIVSNVCPQVGIGFNRGYWAHFEHFVRMLTREFDHIFVITGPLYLPKKEKNDKFYVKYQVIGDPPNIAVPTHFFKSMDDLI